MGWTERAACQDMAVNQFFAADGERGSHLQERYRKARQVCALCPVRAECLADAIKQDDRYGVRGGMTPEERDKYTGRFTADSNIDDGRDDLVILALICGETFREPGLVNIAHACVQLWRSGGVTKEGMARRFGVTASQVRNWVKRAESGHPPIDLQWLARQRAKEESLVMVS